MIFLQTNVTKEELGLELIELEAAVRSVQNDGLVIENELYTLPNDLEKLVIGNVNKYVTIKLIHFIL